MIFKSNENEMLWRDVMKAEKLCIFPKFWMYYEEKNLEMKCDIRTYAQIIFLYYALTMYVYFHSYQFLVQT